MDVVQARLAHEWTAIEQAGELECWCQVEQNCWCAEVGTPVVCLGRLESGDDLLALRLLGLARHGDVAAARVVLQDLLPQLGLTLRRGDLRRINPHRIDLFSPDSLADPGQDDGSAGSISHGNSAQSRQS